MEPKEKHVSFIIECLSGEHAELITYEDAYSFFRKRYDEIKDKNDLIGTAKCFIILHRYLKYNKVYEAGNST